MSAVDRGRLVVLDRSGTARIAVLAGRLSHRAAGAVDLPAVGDWVATEGGGTRVVAMLPRHGALCRTDPLAGGVPQVLAANVDVVLVVTACGGDLNARRVERFITITIDGGAEPVVVLNKADLAIGREMEDALAVLRACVPDGTPVVPVSAVAGDGLDAVLATVPPGATVALLGSSGVGKSTLVNRLIGADRQATGPVRASDGRGRHTTTRRELIPLPGGGALVDTPGLRLPRLWAEGTGLRGTFDDIDALAAQCRFADCGHGTEPGCMVRAAVAAGHLDEQRLTAFADLDRERRWTQERSDPATRDARRRRHKAIESDQQRRDREQW